MRIKNIVRNGFFSLLSQIIIIAVGFFSQRVMFMKAGRELIGMNSVISNIIAILSVSELGVSTAVVYHLYHSLATKNEREIAAYMNFYRKAYVVFAAVITALGLCIMPFVHMFLKDNTYPLFYVRLIYGMWLLRTVLSYLLSYRRSVLIADQREYVVTLVTLAANVLNYLSIIGIVGLTSDYALALGINIMIEIVSNVGLSRYVERLYPYLGKWRKEPLPKEIVHTIIEDVKNIFVTRLSAKLLYCTDNLIISGFINVGTVGLFSNYSLITQSVTNIVLALSNAVQPSIGNLFIEKDQEKDYRVLRLLTFVFFLIAVFASASLLSLMHPFIGDIWLNRNSLLTFAVVICCSLNCFLQTVGLPLSVCMAVSGLFGKERNLTLTSALVNLVVSLWLVKPFGIVGVLIGTGCAHFVQLVMRMHFFFRDYLKRSLRAYAAELLEYTLLAVAEMWGTFEITQAVYGAGGFFRFLFAAAVCVVFPVGCNLVLFCRSERFLEVFRMIKGMLGTSDRLLL